MNDEVSEVLKKVLARSNAGRSRSIQARASKVRIGVTDCPGKVTRTRFAHARDSLSTPLLRRRQPANIIGRKSAPISKLNDEDSGTETIAGADTV